MAIGRYSKIVRVPAGQTVTQVDGVQNQDYFDMNVLVVPRAKFSGKIEFYIGDDKAAETAYNNSDSSAAFCPQPPDFSEIWPSTESAGVVNSDAGLSGTRLKFSVKIINTGQTNLQIEVHFMRKYEGGND